MCSKSIKKKTIFYFPSIITQYKLLLSDNKNKRKTKSIQNIQNKQNELLYYLRIKLIKFLFFSNSNNLAV